MVLIIGDSRNNTLLGTAENDTILGWGGADRLFGGAGNDTIQGGVGSDTLSGGSGNDRLLGGAGRDVLVGGPGADHLNGGAGQDVFRFDDKDAGGGSAADVIHGFTTEDVLDLRDADILYHDVDPDPGRGGFNVRQDAGNTYVSWNTFGEMHTVKLAGFTGEPDIVWYDDDHPGDLGSGPALVEGQTLRGEFEVTEDHDWFKIDVEAGRLYTIDIRGGASGAGTAWTPWATVFDADHRYVAWQELERPRYADSDGRTYFAAQTAGTYYVEASTLWSDSGVGTYSVSLSSRPYVDDVSDFETGASAGTTFKGKIGYPVDADWFRLDFEPGKVYTIELKGASSGSGTLHDPVLILDDPLDEEGDLFDDDSGVGLDARIVVNPEYWALGPYAYIGALSGDEQPGSYKLVVTAEDADPDAANGPTASNPSKVVAEPEATPALRPDPAVPVAAAAAAPGKLIVGSPAPDALAGTARSDRILGLGGSDQLSGGAGHDTIEGGAGNDTISGQSGNDRLVGGVGSDHLVGGGGSDVLVGGLGRDLMRGGEGADVFRFGAEDAGDATAGPRSDVIYDFGPDDVLDIRQAGVLGTGWLSTEPEPAPGTFGIWYGGGSAYVTWNTGGVYHDVELVGCNANRQAVYDQVLWHDDDFPDDFGTNVTIAKGQTLHGTIEVAGDEDWFRIDMVAGRTYYVDVDGETFDPWAQIVDGSGNLLSRHPGGDPHATLAAFAATSGPGYLRLGNPDYVPGTYSVSLVAVDRVGSDMRYHGEIAAGQTLTGVVDAPDDQDWYAIELTKGERCTIDLRGLDSHSGTLPDPFLRLIDPEGNWIKINNDGGAGRDAKIVYTAEASGTYYIDAQDNGEGVGTYELTVTGQHDLLFL